MKFTLEIDLDKNGTDPDELVETIGETFASISSRRSLKGKRALLYSASGTVVGSWSVS